MILLGFIAVGLSLLLGGMRVRVLRILAEVLAIAAALEGFALTVGACLGVRGRYSVAPFDWARLGIALALLAAAVGTMARRPRGAIVSVLLQATPGGLRLRRVLPVVMSLPLILGWLRMQGQYAGWSGTEFGLAFMVTASASILASLAVWIAHLQARSDAASQVAVRDERFVFDLGEQLRLRGSSTELLALVTKHLGAHLGVSRALFMQVDPAANLATVRDDYHDGLFSLAGVRSIGAFSPELVAEARAGRTVVCREASEGGDGDPYRAAAIGARIAVPLLRSGQWVSTLLVTVVGARTWQTREIVLVQTVAERAWLWFEHLVAIEAIRSSEARFHALVQASSQMVWTAGPDGQSTDDASAFAHFMGLTPAQWNGPERRAAYHPDDRDRVIALWKHCVDNGTKLELEFRVRHHSGAWRWLAVCGVPLTDATGVVSQWVGMNTDITDRKDAEGLRENLVQRLSTINAELETRVEERTVALMATLKEREVLLQEIHHRVKNNLQVISSLISMQMRQVSDASARTALAECRARVETIGLVHEQLYRARDYARVPFTDYAQSLTSNIFRTSGISPALVSLECEIEDAALPVDRAIPCGLILNELMTNALKHGFPAGRRGKVRVALHHTGPQVITLSVEDDGVGLPIGLSTENIRSLGMQLVTTLVEQLDGTMEIERGAGTKFHVQFSTESQA